MKSFFYLFSLGLLLILTKKSQQLTLPPPQGVYFTYHLKEGQNVYHGFDNNTIIGGTCTEFLALNKINQCCSERQDECHMRHFDTLCYCDKFCIRVDQDCCPDAIETCGGVKSTPTTTTTTKPTTRISKLNFNKTFHKLKIICFCRKMY